ncbi:MAG: hypothetical protein ACK4NF_07080 [Planctomycetota bacterium]
MTNFEQYFKTLSQSFYSHLNISFHNAITVIIILIPAIAGIYLLIKTVKRSKIRRYYGKIFAEICEGHQLSIEEKIKLNYLAHATRLKHPLFLTIQPKRWHQYLSDPEVALLYRKMFG